MNARRAVVLLSGCQCCKTPAAADKSATAAKPAAVVAAPVELRVLLQPATRAVSAASDTRPVTNRVLELGEVVADMWALRELGDPRHARLEALETLGFHGEGLERIHNSLKQKTGMVLATGPTGSLVTVERIPAGRTSVRP